MRRVVDGDTLVVSFNDKENRIRLYGIDAPERGQPYYNEAKEYLESIVDERADLYKMDQKRSYRRTVAIVYSGDNRDESLNMQMLRSGYAFYDPYSGQLKGGQEAELEASRERRGMWANQLNLEKPWDYRAKEQTKPASQEAELDVASKRRRRQTRRHQQTTRKRPGTPKSIQASNSKTSRYVAIAVAALLIFVFMFAVCNN